MSDYTESELYSIFANVGYEINQGKTLEEIEQEIKQDYGLDIKLDKELSDEFGAIIKYRDEIIHSVRGTNDAEDFLVDLNFMTSHSYYGTATTLFFSLLGANKKRKGLMDYYKDTPENPDFIKNTARNFANSYHQAREQSFTTRDIEEGFITRTNIRNNPQFGVIPEELLEEGFADILELAHDEVMEEIDRLSFLERRRSTKDYNQMRNYVLIMTGMLTVPYIIKTALEYYIGTTLRGKRVNREFKRFDDAKAKYPNLKMSLTGHSLGAIANDIGRTHNVKSITFNPAPMDHNNKQPHKDSKIYRMKNDIVSYFLTRNDKEDTQHIPKYPSYYNLDWDLLNKIHTLDNFLPPKRRRLSSSPRPIPPPPPPPQKVHTRLRSINKDDILTRERPIIKIMNEYSAMIEDSLEEFLPNYQQQDLGFIHKNKFKHKLKKKYIFSI